jgi:hypothetical protein
MKIYIDNKLNSLSFYFLQKRSRKYNHACTRANEIARALLGAGDAPWFAPHEKKQTGPGFQTKPGPSRL